nr:MAG TPA: hypothetical protein [Caudoviricetes sp.]
MRICTPTSAVRMSASPPAFQAPQSGFPVRFPCPFLLFQKFFVIVTLFRQNFLDL